MMSYKVVQTAILRTGEVTPVWEIVEKRPAFGEDVTIKVLQDEDTAKKMSRNLNFGHGFDGWTPNFFNLQYNVV